MSRINKQTQKYVRSNASYLVMVLVQELLYIKHICHDKYPRTFDLNTQRRSTGHLCTMVHVALLPHHAKHTIRPICVSLFGLIFHIWAAGVHYRIPWLNNHYCIIWAVCYKSSDWAVPSKNFLLKYSLFPSAMKTASVWKDDMEIDNWEPDTSSFEMNGQTVLPGTVAMMLILAVWVSSLATSKPKSAWPVGLPVLDHASFMLSIWEVMACLVVSSLKTLLKTFFPRLQASYQPMKTEMPNYAKPFHHNPYSCSFKYLDSVYVLIIMIFHCSCSVATGKSWWSLEVVSYWSFALSDANKVMWCTNRISCQCGYWTTRWNYSRCQLITRRSWPPEPQHKWHVATGMVHLQLLILTCDRHPLLLLNGSVYFDASWITGITFIW